MNNIPLVSIGIPTRNRLNYLKEAIESSIFQTYDNIEIIVSNNCSEDKTEEYLESIVDPRVKKFKQDNLLDMVDNWNFCLDKSIGKYFILLSDDDKLDLNAIEKINYSFQSNNFKDNVAVFGCSYINENGFSTKKITYKLKRIAKNYILSKYLFKFFTVPMCSTVYNTAALREVGGYSRKNILAADTLAWLSVVFQYGALYFFPEKISNYRIHSQMTTKKSYTSLWIKEYINLTFTLCKKIPLIEKPLVLIGLFFVILKQLIKHLLRD